MAVIIDMDMPKNCNDCMIKKCKAIDIQNGLNNRSKDCPLKSADYLKPVIHAKWVDKGAYVECSKCACLAPCTETADSFLWKLSNYCPDCGAKMDKEG